MKITRSGALRLITQLGAVAVLIGAAGFVASSAYTRDTSQTVSYVCRDGERFAVEHQPNHVRLRTGAGVFALAGEQADGLVRYSDGSTVLRMNGEEAILERPGLATPAGCTAAVTTL